MRVIVLSDLPPFVLGGAEQQVELLVSAWIQAGVDVLVLGHRTPGGTHGQVSARQIPVLRWLGRPIRAVTFALSLAALLLAERRRTDVIYCRFLGEAALVTIVLKQLGLLRQPLVITIAAAGNGEHSDVARLLSMRGGVRLLGLARRHVDAFNAISQGVAQDLQRAGLTVSAHIPNGVRIPAHEPGATAAQRYWLFVGRLSPQKGVDLLLDAIALLRSRSTTIELRIVGEGLETASLIKQRDRLGLREQVYFLGRLSHCATLALLPHAHALVLPSRYEGLSNAALEALAAGTPVIATRCGGVDQYLEDGAGWVCEASAESIADAIERSAGETLQSHLLRRERCRALATSRFSIESCADAHLKLFRALCESPR